MKKAKLFTVVGLVFVAGIFVGVAGTKFVIGKAIAEATQKPELVRERIERDLARQLQLTPEQRPKVHEICRHAFDELQAMRRDLRPRVGLVLRRSEQDLRGVLTPEQQSRLSEILKKRPLPHQPGVNARPERSAAQD